jgi:FtsP/CotA-like multicopper oxidase with cupredoxin domain
MQAKRGPLVAAGLLVVAVVLFIVLKSGSDESPVTTGLTKIEVKNGAVVGGVRDITVNKGDRVQIDVTPDVPAEVHLHGYELAKDVESGQTAHFDFSANIDGEFEVEVHHLVNGEEKDTVLVANLTVNP